MVATESDEVPFYLMPVAAFLGIWSLIFALRLAFVIYANVVPGKSPPNIKLGSQNFLILVGLLAVTSMGYAKIVATVENAVAQSQYALFDPYEILQIDTSQGNNATLVKQAYRQKSKIHHPDRPGGDARSFARLNTAYRALTTDRENYELYGHPDGPVQTRDFAFALPEWLLQPKGNIALVMLLMYLGMFAALIYFVIQWSSRASQGTTTRGVPSDAENQDKSIANDGADAKYLAKNLTPDSTHIEILYLLASTPESILRSTRQLEKREELVAQTRKQLAEEESKKKKSQSSSSDPFDLDAGGWDEDDKDDEKVQKARLEEDKKAKAKKALDQAQGKINFKLEGIHDGVLGQEWVEQVLSDLKVWPPKKLGILEGKTFGYKNKELGPLDHPAIRRTLVMTTGRLNSTVLNTHPELLAAFPKGLIDQTYFKATMDYRNRAAMLLELCLQIALRNQSYRLAKTIIETNAMFKLGVPEGSGSVRSVEFFHNQMRKQYGEEGIPKLAVENLLLETPDEEQMATGDMGILSMDIKRRHAEVMTKAKVLQAQKQGIPPQVALSTYREGWWLLVRAERLDGGDFEPVKMRMKEKPNDPVTAALEAATEQRLQFEKEPSSLKICMAWPMMVSNMAQQGGKVKLKFAMPQQAGKYKFFVEIKSHEFVGCDDTHEILKDIVDIQTLGRAAKTLDDVNKKIEEELKKGKKENENESNTTDAEPKKEK